MPRDSTHKVSIMYFQTHSVVISHAYLLGLDLLMTSSCQLCVYNPARSLAFCRESMPQILASFDPLCNVVHRTRSYRNRLTSCRDNPKCPKMVEPQTNYRMRPAGYPHTNVSRSRCAFNQSSIWPRKKISVVAPLNASAPCSAALHETACESLW